ncbi:MAG: enoyl-CoA hydratase/isomerase family protein [Stenotrophobium sp.]
MSLPETKTVLLRQDRGVLHVTLNRPESRNAMTPEMLAELEAVFAAIRDTREVRAVVLRGAGGHFCAGADLKGMFSAIKPLKAGEADPIIGINRAFGTMLRQVENAPQVVIAICEGGVLGGGFGLACVSDIAFAHTDTKFGMPETSRGLPPAQIAPFVVQRIGLTQARRLVLTSAQFRGEEALRLGLVHEVFASEEELQTKLGTTLQQVLNCAPNANALSKQIVLNAGHQEMGVVLDDAAQKFAACARGPEAPEGIGAFMQKRKPRWASGS